MTVDKLPFPQDKLISTIHQMADTTCDAGGTSGSDGLGSIVTGEDFEGTLVKLHAVKVVPFNTDPTDPAPGGSFRVAGPYPTLHGHAADLDQDDSYTYDPVPGHIIDVAGVLRFPFSAFRVYPRDNNDIKDYGTNGVPGGIPAEVSFRDLPQPVAEAAGHLRPAQGGQRRCRRLRPGRPQARDRGERQYPAGTHTAAWNGLDSRGNPVGSGCSSTA